MEISILGQRGGSRRQFARRSFKLHAYIADPVVLIHHSKDNPAGMLTGYNRIAAVLVTTVIPTGIGIFCRIFKQVLLDISRVRTL